MPEDNKKLIIVGTTTKLGNFIFKYPDRIILIFLLIGACTSLLERGTELLWRSVWAPSCFYLPMLLLVYLMGNKWCYKIEIDKIKNTITFYRLFNREVHTFMIEKTKVIIGMSPHIIISGFDFIIHQQYIHKLVSYLPKDTVIEYKGRYGRNYRNYWEKNNNKLLPGTRL